MLLLLLLRMLLLLLRGSRNFKISCTGSSIFDAGVARFAVASVSARADRCIPCQAHIRHFA